MSSKMTQIARASTAKSGGSIFFRYDNTPWAIAFKFFNVLFIIIIAAASLYPFVFVLSQSISDLDALARGDVKLFPKGFSSEGYTRVFKNNLILGAYRNTIIYSVSGVVLHLLCCAVGAYPLSISKFYGRSAVSAFMAFTMFFSGGIIPTYLLIKGLGMINTIWAIILPGAFGFFHIVIMRTNFQNVPVSLRESAQMDGASHWKVLFSIIIPLSKAIIATLFLFIIVDFWNEFFRPLIYMNDLNKQPLQVILRQLIVKESYADFGGLGDERVLDDELVPPAGLAASLKAAGVIVSIGPILLAYPFIQRYFVKGALIGSIKGGG